MRKHIYWIIILRLFLNGCVSGNNNITRASSSSYKHFNQNMQNRTKSVTTTQNFMMVGLDGMINQYNPLTGQYKSIIYPKIGILGISVNSNGKFIATGNSGVILTSDDGVIWNSESSGTSNSLNGVAVNNNGLFVIVGESGTIVTSDGWCPVSSELQISSLV